MKNMLVIAALAITLGCSAQTVKEADVPAPVKAKFASLYPNMKAEEWEKEGLNYEAEFEQNKTETSVVFDANGNLISTETEIAVNSLPKNISDYFAKNKAGMKISEASEITAADGTVTYEVEIKDGDYLFDANGNFIRKTTGDETEENDKD